MNTKKREILKRCISLALILSTSTILNTAHAEEEMQTFDLDAVVVTATKVEKTVLEVPASVTVVTSKDIEKMNARTIDDALKKSAGVYINRSRGVANTSTVTMRGISSSSQVLIMVDGQTMNDAYSGGVNWSAIPVDSVERIEVVKGAASSLYGSSAMGGVINIITKTPEKREIKITNSWGSDNTKINRVTVNDKINDKLSFRLAFEHRGTEGSNSRGGNLSVITPKTTTSSTTLATGVSGFTLTKDKTGKDAYLVGYQGNNSWNENDLNGKLNYKIDDNRNLSLGFSHHYHTYSYNYSLQNSYLRAADGTPFLSGNVDVGGGKYITVANSTFLATPGEFEENIYTIGYKDNKNKITVNAGLEQQAVNRYFQSATSITGGSATVIDYPSKRYNFNIQKELKLGKDEAVFGIQYSRDWMDKTNKALTDWTNLNSVSAVNFRAKANAKTFALFGQNEHKLSDKLSLTSSLRYDTWSTFDSMVRFNSTHTEYYSARDDSALSPKLALNYTINKDSSAYISWGKAFGIPSLYNMFSGAITGSSSTPYANRSYSQPNPELKPQRIKTVEVGCKNKLDIKTAVGVTYFHNNITDMFYTVTLPTDTLIDGVAYKTTQLQNAGEGTTDGVELEINHKFNDKWSGFLNYTYQNPIISKCSSNPLYEGKIVTYVPKQMFNIGFDYEYKKWSAELIGTFQSKRYTLQDNSDTATGVFGTSDAFFSAKLGIGYKINKDMSVRLDVDNLLDRNYFSYYQAAGRSYTLQVTKSF